MEVCSQDRAIKKELLSKASYAQQKKKKKRSFFLRRTNKRRNCGQLGIECHWLALGLVAAESSGIFVPGAKMALLNEHLTLPL